MFTLWMTRALNERSKVVISEIIVAKANRIGVVRRSFGEPTKTEPTETVWPINQLN